MSEGRQLAQTGLGTMTVFGVAVNEKWLLLVAVALVVVAAAALRLMWRRGRGVQD
ncbi:MAG: hypothetical protein FWE15_15935 [Actinomycetia bacterium]|nr:hypothetical protein [Actinomycetes bacterium]MCL2731503.1 hypothetical protein [Actinomycetes bacterium]